MIHNRAYEVDLLEANEVIEDIKSKFIGSETSRELNKSNNLDKVVSQYIDNYEKVEHNNKEYFVLKSRIPVEFKQKSYTKKYIAGDEMAGRVFGSLGLPIMFIATNLFDAVCNFKNMISSSFGSTKINAKFRDSETTILCILVVVLNILFWGWFINSVQNEHLPVWLLFVTQVINLALGVLKPFSYQYNRIENYKLAPYTFDTKYESLSADPMEKLRSMKSTPDKKKIDFDFTDEVKDKTKEKEKNYASY